MYKNALERMKHPSTKQNLVYDKDSIFKTMEKPNSHVINDLGISG
jgi:hypothetical protein